MDSPQVVFSRWARIPAEGSAPTKRCGHTFTAVSGEGTRRLILFGGATALESSGSSTGGASGIRACPSSPVLGRDLRASSRPRVSIA